MKQIVLQTYSFTQFCTYSKQHILHINTQHQVLLFRVGSTHSSPVSHFSTHPWFFTAKKVAF